VLLMLVKISNKSGEFFYIFLKNEIWWWICCIGRIFWFFLEPTTALTWFAVATQWKIKDTFIFNWNMCFQQNHLVSEESITGQLNWSRILVRAKFASKVYFRPSPLQRKNINKSTRNRYVLALKWCAEDSRKIFLM
jgi:hypothetical protein